MLYIIIKTLKTTRMPGKIPFAVLPFYFYLKKKSILNSKNYIKLFYVLCFMFYVLCFMFYVLCFMFYVLCFKTYKLFKIDLIFNNNNNATKMFYL